jgi:Zn-dependent protease with chaperone function
MLFIRYPTSGLAVFFAFALSSCEPVPITQRQQLILVPSSSIVSISPDFYRQFIVENRLSAGGRADSSVKRVGRRIQGRWSNTLLRQACPTGFGVFNGTSSSFKKTEANAFCLSNGKVVIYTGILPITQDDTGLAYSTRPRDCPCGGTSCSRANEPEPPDGDGRDGAFGGIGKGVGFGK